MSAGVPMRRRLLVEYLRTVIGVRDERVLEAVAAVPREVFVPPSLFPQAYEDFPLEIGEGQTISQPSVVARMTELAAIGERDRVLEIGAGSGYQVAVLAHLARFVFAVERLPRLAEAARGRLLQLGFSNVSIQVMDGTLGWRAQAPFDAIIVSAAAPAVPSALKEQLVDGGRLVIPVGDLRRQELHRVVRRGERLRGHRPRGRDVRAPGGQGGLRQWRAIDLSPAPVGGGMLTRRFLVSGRVQGVGFRYFVAREARSLTLDGWVRNLPDGRVEAAARGDSGRIEALLGRLWQGSPMSRVLDVTVEDVTDEHPRTASPSSRPRGAGRAVIGGQWSEEGDSASCFRTADRGFGPTDSCGLARRPLGSPRTGL